MKKIEPLLDLKFYLPTERWHVVRFVNPITQAFTRVWECDDRPDLGLRKELGTWIIDALKEGDLKNYAARRVKEIDEHNQNLEENQKKKYVEDARDYASDLRKPLQHLYNYGPDSKYKGLF